MYTNQNASDENTIRNLLETWAAAVRAKDIEGIVRHHSANIVMFDVPPPLQSKGIDAYRRTWDLFFSWARDPVVFDILEMSVTSGTEVAFVVASMRCSGRETTGEDIDLKFRLTVGLRKTDDQWTVMHEHHSVPATS